MRAKNVAKNSFFSVFSQVLIIFAGFFSQRVINVKLGTELVGLNGVISNVIMVFSVSELGISTAIVFHLYQALSTGEEKRIAALMNLYRRAYYAVAGTMLTLGLGFLPFIHLLMKENHFSTAYIRMIYGLWLIRTVLGYFLSYKRSIVIADQKEYVTSLATMAISIFNYLSIIMIVTLWNDYVMALIFGIVFEEIVNVLLICYVNKHYPYLKQYSKIKVDKEKRGRIFSDIKNLFVTRVAQKLLSSTDNIIMSVFISLSTVGFYANYCLITQSLINIMQALSNALQPTVGNLAVENKKDRDEDLLHSFTLVFFFLSSIIMAGVAGMASLFVSDIWLGKEFVLSARTVYFCAFNCMLYIMILPIGVFISVSGLFRQEKIVSFLAAILNLVISLLLVRELGIIGVLIGTTVAYVTLFVGKAYFYFQQHLKRVAWSYMCYMAGYVLLASLEALMAQKAAALIYGEGGLMRFILAGISCVMIPAFCNLLVLGRGKHTKQTIEFVRNYKRHTQQNESV